ncbi:ZIP family metal transporter [Halobacteriales archaeon QS_1_68_20]|nr:MAG: ZIP family metal transporter [Halobacteriales archaeon QS_1_68_20]
MNGASRIGVAGVVGLVALSALAVQAGLWKLLGISWVAFVAMAGGAPLGARAADGEHARRLVWGYGLASGAMITSALVFIVPGAIDHHATYGGFGVALGVLAGFTAHTVGHRATHRELPLDHTVVELSAHALTAGAIIGIVYGNMPELGPLLGLAIVSHKGPAGYAAGRRLGRQGRSPWVLLLPAAGVGLTAIPAGLVALPANPVVNAVVFGFAAGVFLHVAMDFLPRCELGGEVYEVAQLSTDAHELLDHLRLHAVGSTALGGVAVFVAWFALA